MDAPFGHPYKIFTIPMSVPTEKEHPHANFGKDW